MEENSRKETGMTIFDTIYNMLVAFNPAKTEKELRQTTYEILSVVRIEEIRQISDQKV